MIDTRTDVRSAAPSTVIPLIIQRGRVLLSPRLLSSACPAARLQTIRPQAVSEPLRIS